MPVLRDAVNDEVAGPRSGSSGWFPVRCRLVVVVAHEDITAANPPVPERGIRAAALRDFARRQGLQAFIVEGQLADLDRELARRRPVLVGVMKRYGGRAYPHYEVVVGVSRRQRRILTLDPAHGLRVNSREGFAAEWTAAGRLTLIVFPRAAPSS